VGETYRFVLPRLGTLIWAGILTVLVIYLGLILCIVPGIIFACWFWLTTPAVVVENLKATKAMSRSKALVSGNLGKVFVIGFVVFCIALVVNWACGTISGLLSAGAAQENRLLALIIQQVVALVGQVLVAPIGAAACILFYYDMRIRKEAFDLEMLANSMGGAGGPPNVGTPVQ
jgi:hypothetical protein